MSLVSSAARLLTDPHSFDMTDRHEHTLDQVIASKIDGFLMSELADLALLIPACYGKIDSFPRMHEIIIQLIHISAFPFSKEKSSDEKMYTQHATKFIQVKLLVVRYELQ